MSTTLLGMHMSDGIVNGQTSAVFGAIALAGMGVALMRARGQLDERTAPMAGLVAAFVFAVQMVNFPVLPGVSGHLLGGALAALLVGPWLGALCVGIVLVVQALLFADGGLTALGTNITNMAILGTAVGFGTALALRRIAMRSRGGLIGVAFVSAFVNTVIASCGFVLQYAIGGAGGASPATVAVSIIAVHVLIGIGEGVITALTVGAVSSARPDLVYLLRTAPSPASPAAAPAPTSGSAT